MCNNNDTSPIPSDFFLYKDGNREVKVEIYIFNETVWLIQDKIALLFGVQRPTVTRHLKNIFESGELAEKSVSSKMELTAADDKKYQTKLYNLDAILSVGYRVNNIQATHFRIWANSVLKEYLIKGFAMNAKKSNMGLTTWRNAPNGMIRKPDVSIAKNYLNETEMDDLNRIVSMYPDYAERQAKKEQVMYMKDWVKKLDAFLQLNEEAVLQDSGRVSHEVAKALAEQEYDKFHAKQLQSYESDFDKLLKGMNHD